MDPTTSVVIFTAGLALVALIWALRRRAARDEAEAYAALERAREEEAHLPPSLHPVIDTQKCMGSLSCVSACPEGKILGIVEGAATLVRGSACIGHGRCALECPVDAIKLVFGSSERGVDLPEVDEHFQSSRPGVFVIGELGGMGLIKNAMIQGLQAGAHLGRELSASSGDALDVLVVGAGPAGIACGAALTQAGLRLAIVDQASLGGAIATFPRQKVVMTERVDVPGFGPFGRRRLSKEDLVEDLSRLVSQFRLPVHEGVRVEGVRGADGAFVVDTNKGEIRARKVVLAIGRRGTPRKLNIPGEDTPKVTYSLIDPEQYAGKRVVVVGGGDSAVEAAVSLGPVAAHTTICYRKPGFNRCRAPNREALDAAARAGEVDVRTQAELTEITPDAVTVRGPNGLERLPNDFVIVCAGGELPVGFLTRSQISMRRHTGAEGMASPAAKPKKRRGEYVSTSEEEERAKNRRLGWILTAVGVTIVAALTYLGYGYYALPEEARLDSPMHEAWRPAGDIGHGIGVVATLVMLSNFLYPLRKRLGFLKGTAPIRRWLTFHVFVGLLSPAVIVFHAAFQSNNLIATGTFWSLLVVVGTGLLGRFVYGLVPRAQGRVMAREVLEEEVFTIHTRLLEQVEHSKDPGRLREALDTLTPRFDRRHSVIGLVVRYPVLWLAEQVRLTSQRSLFSDPAEHAQYAHASQLLFRLKTQLELYEALRRFLGWWRVLHVSLALLLVVIMGAHIGVALYLGYGWILF